MLPTLRPKDDHRRSLALKVQSLDNPDDHESCVLDKQLSFRMDVQVCMSRIDHLSPFYTSKALGQHRECPGGSPQRARRWT